jgi:hypothetical protein
MICTRRGSLIVEMFSDDVQCWWMNLPTLARQSPEMASEEKSREPDGCRDLFTAQRRADKGPCLADAAH